MLTAKEYIQKANVICADYEKSQRCKECILIPFGCGIPAKCDDETIDKVIDLVDNYELHEYPFGRCAKCGYELNSELINEYNVKFCPECGGKLDKRIKSA